jgi:hypothetical protein
MHRTLPLIAVGFALLCGPAQAVDPYAAGTPLQVTLMQEAGGFEIPFYDAFITVGENKFTFVVPQGFRLKNDPATGRLVLGNENGDCYLCFTILSSTAEASEMSADACRACLLKQHPSGKIFQEFSPGVAGHAGRGFDIQWKATEEITLCERFALVPTVYGTFVFTAISSRNHFSTSKANLGLVTGTFRVGTDGKFKPVHILGEN